MGDHEKLLKLAKRDNSLDQNRAQETGRWRKNK